MCDAVCSPVGQQNVVACFERDGVDFRCHACNPGRRFNDSYMRNCYLQKSHIGGIWREGHLRPFWQW